EAGTAIKIPSTPISRIPIRFRTRFIRIFFPRRLAIVAYPSYGGKWKGFLYSPARRMKIARQELPGKREDITSPARDGLKFSIAQLPNYPITPIINLHSCFEDANR